MLVVRELQGAKKEAARWMKCYLLKWSRNKVLYDLQDFLYKDLNAKENALMAILSAVGVDGKLFKK